MSGDPKASDAKVLSTSDLVRSQAISVFASKLTQPQTHDDARWTKLVLTTYRDPLGKERTWESAERSVSLPFLPREP